MKPVSVVKTKIRRENPSLLHRKLHKVVFEGDAYSENSAELLSEEPADEAPEK